MCKNILIKAKIKLNNIAHQKLVTIKPGTIQEASSTINALMKKVNNPSVKMLIGRVNNIIKGFIKTFKTPKTIAITTAIHILGTVTPADKIYPVTKTAKDFINNSKNTFMFFN